MEYYFLPLILFMLSDNYTRMFNSLDSVKWGQTFPFSNQYQHKKSEKSTFRIFRLNFEASYAGGNTGKLTYSDENLLPFKASSKEDRVSGERLNLSVSSRLSDRLAGYRIQMQVQMIAIFSKQTDFKRL